MKQYFAFGLVLLLASCSNPQDATEANFKKAAQDYLDVSYPYCYFTGNFPMEYEESSVRSSGQSEAEALVAAGLLKESSSEMEKPRMFGPGTMKTTVYQYELTPEGQKYYKPDVVDTFGGKVGGFCAGKAQVQSIERFTDPADMFGYKISKVSYTYSVSGFPVWTEKAELQAIGRSLREDVESMSTPKKETRAFVLTNQGWIHEKLYKKQQ